MLFFGTWRENFLRAGGTSRDPTRTVGGPGGPHWGLWRRFEDEASPACSPRVLKDALCPEVLESEV